MSPGCRLRAIAHDNLEAAANVRIRSSDGQREFFTNACTGGKTSDFVEFARVLRGKRVSIDTFSVPATSEIVHDLQSTRWDGKTIWQILLDPGVQMTENAGCAGCLGGPVETFCGINRPGIKSISATNRNFPDRMGDKEWQVFLPSPMTVAASAITGKVTDPREYLR